MKNELIRTDTFSPYIEGANYPTFTLNLYDTHTVGEYKKARLGYELIMNNVLSGEVVSNTLLFTGEDYFCSPLHSIDSDGAVKGIMCFLTLREGDTDSDYFTDYSPEQITFRDNHAETLSCEVMCLFGED